jgi:hypothetical protein
MTAKGRIGDGNIIPKFFLRRQRKKSKKVYLFANLAPERLGLVKGKIKTKN